jgi:hypothetical protein
MANSETPLKEIAMFGLKNAAVQIKVVNTKKQDADTNVAEESTLDPEQIAQIATEFAVKTIGAVGVAIAANRVLTTLCDVVVIAAKAKFK